MKKKMSLEVQKMKKPAKRNMKTFLKQVVDYLKSDTYMFAPLVSLPVSKFPGSSTTSSAPITGLEIKDNMNGRKNKILAEKVGEYLKSDSYLYAPLFLEQTVSSPKGHARYLKKVATEISTMTMEDQISNDNIPVGSISDQQKYMHKETVKRTVFQTCRYSSVPGEGAMESQLNKLLVD